MGAHYLFLKTLSGEKYIYIVYILYVYFGISNKTLPLSSESLKHVRHSDAHNSSEKKEKGKKEKNIQLTTFRDTSNITKYFENYRVHFN